MCCCDVWDNVWRLLCGLVLSTASYSWPWKLGKFAHLPKCYVWCLLWHHRWQRWQHCQPPRHCLRCCTPVLILSMQRWHCLPMAPPLVDDCGRLPQASATHQTQHTRPGTSVLQTTRAQCAWTSLHPRTDPCVQAGVLMWRVRIAGHSMFTTR